MDVFFVETFQFVVFMKKTTNIREFGQNIDEKETIYVEPKERIK